MPPLRRVADTSTVATNDGPGVSRKAFQELTQSAEEEEEEAKTEKDEAIEVRASRGLRRGQSVRAGKPLSCRLGRRGFC